MKLEHGTWVVVADGEKFLLLRNIGDQDFMHLEVVDHETSENAPARELASDRAGRQQDAKRKLRNVSTTLRQRLLDFKLDFLRLALAG